jgi:hypothetical protein
MLQNRTYFFNVKENRLGDLYLNIVESKNRDTGGFERQSVILFGEDLQEFLKGFDDSLRVLEKAIRERKKSGYRRDRAGEDYGEGRRQDRDREDREDRSSEDRGPHSGYGEDRGAYNRGREDRGERGTHSGYGENRGAYNRDRGPRSRGGYGEDRGDSSSYSRGSEDRNSFRRGGGEADRRAKDRGEYPPKDGAPARKPRRLVAKKRDL